MIDQANTTNKGSKIEGSAHVLRHTFLRNVAEQKGLQAALALCANDDETVTFERLV
jgi:hypothetical protein